MTELCRTILLVEDNDDDAFAMRWALKKANLPHRLQVVEDGQRALDYLAGVGAYADREVYPAPCFIFLDLKLPFLSGFEVLSWIRRQAALAGVPVAILTGSDEARDHDQAQALGCQAYLVKPPSPEDLVKLLH